VLFVVTPVPLGGSNRSMVTLLKSLEGRVHRVLASPGFGDFRELVIAEGLSEELVDLPRKPGSAFDRLLRVLSGLKIAWWAMRNRRRVRAIHANALTGLNMSLPAALVSRLRTVVWIHDPVGSQWGSRLGPVIRRLLPGLRIAAVSRTAEEVALDNGLCAEGDAVLIPNPIDPDDVLAPRKSPGDEVVIGILGGASERKGFDLLPAAVDSLSNQSVKWMLYVSERVEPGMEPTWKSLRAQPSDRVVVAEKVSDVRKAYEGLDIVFCPSRNESFCRVAAEAMLNGIPVVGSDIEPLRALLGNNDAGLLFPVGDGAAASGSLQRLVVDPQLRASLGREGKKRAARFKPEAIAGQLMGLYGINR